MKPRRHPTILLNKRDPPREVGSVLLAPGIHSHKPGLSNFGVGLNLVAFCQVWELLFSAASVGDYGQRRAGGGAGTGLNVKEQSCSPLKNLSASRDKEGLTSFIYGRTRSPETREAEKVSDFTELRTGRRNAFNRTQMWGFCLSPNALGTLDDQGNTHSNS